MKKQNNRREFVRNLCLIVGIVLILSCFIIPDDSFSDAGFYNQMLTEAEFVEYLQFKEDMSNGLVDDVYYRTDNQKMVYTLFNEESIKSEEPQFEYDVEDARVTMYPAGETFREDLLSKGVDLWLVQDSKNWNSILSILIMCIPLIPLAILMMAMTKRISPDTGEFDKSIIQTSNVKLSDVIGLDETMFDLQIIIDLISDASRGSKLGAKIPHGILLSGPAGVGKTMIAKAISSAANVPFISVNGSDFQEIYVGNGARHVRQLFRTARQNAPCIIFIDEFDSLGEKRDSINAGAEDSRTINALLKEMDGFKPLDGVFVIAATNFPDKLDSAVRRSGRFDREVVISPPKDWRVREELFKLYLKDKPMAEDVNIPLLAKTVSGFTGADIAAVCNEAALVAMARNLEYITNSCIDEAIDRKIFKGSYSKNKQSENDKRVVAYHEAGHAIMSHILGLPVSRISVKPTTSGVGGAVFNKDTDTKLKSAKYLFSRVLVCYAGRAAEEIVFGYESITTGASNDIEQATGLLLSIVGQYGMDKDMGLLNYSILHENGVETNVLDKVASLSASSYKKACDFLEEHMRELRELAEHLMEVETMTEDDFVEFLGASMST